MMKARRPSAEGAAVTSPRRTVRTSPTAGTPPGRATYGAPNVGACSPKDDRSELGLFARKARTSR